MDGATASVVCSAIIGAAAAVVTGMIKFIPRNGSGKPGTTEVCLAREQRITKTEQVIVRLDERVSHILGELQEIKGDVKQLVEQKQK